MKRRHSSLMLAFAASAVLSMVAVPVRAKDKKPKKTEEPPAPTVATLSVDLPSLAILEGTDQSQTKGDLRITVSTETFVAKESFRTEQKEVPPPSKLGFTLVPCPNGVYVERTQIPELKVVPEGLAFHVHINNQMPR